MPPYIQTNIPLAPRTSLKVGGNAEFFCEITSDALLEEALTWAQNNNHKITILGGGSNVLIADAGIQGLVLSLNTKGITYTALDDDTFRVRVAGGETWDDFVRAVVERKLWGLENLSGIPGNVGAAPVQNINAYGVSVGDTIESVEVCHLDTQEKKVLTHEECEFAYRDSFFKTEAGKKYCITEVTFILRAHAQSATTYISASQSIAKKLIEKNITVPTSNDIRDVVLEIRKNIGMLPNMYQSAGSFFKNTIVSREQFAHIAHVVAEKHRVIDEKFTPWYWELPNGNIKVSTAFLMECTEYNKTKFAEQTHNDVVGISPRHTLSLITVGNATAKDVQEFAEKIITAVYTEFNVRIETEVCFLS